MLNNLKDSAKNIARNNLGQIVLIAVLCVMLVTLTLLSKMEKDEADNGREMEITGIVTNVYYSETDDDAKYNYMINPSMLDKKGISVEHIQDISDEVNRAVKDSGSTGKELKISSVKTKGTKVMFYISVEGEEKTFYGEYDKATGEIKCEIM